MTYTNDCRKLRILILTSDRFPFFRPAAKLIFTDEFQKRGHIVDWIVQASSADGEVGTVPWGQGNAYVCGTNDGRSRLHRLTKHLRDIRNDLRVVSLLRRDRYDLVQVKDKYLAALIAIVVARVRRIPFFYWLAYPHGDAALLSARTGIARYRLQRLLKGHLYRWLLYHVVLPQSDHVFVQSEQMREDLVAEGIPRNKMTPIPSSVNLAQIDKLEAVLPILKPDGEQWVTYLGTLLRVRKLDFLVRAFYGVNSRFPGAKLYFIGSGEDPDDERMLLDEVRRLGLENSIYFTGQLPMHEAWNYVRASDVCVSPYFPTPVLNSTSPTKLIEYLALSCPVICNEHPEQRQVVEASHGGLCRPWLEHDFAEGIIHLLENPQVAKEMGRRGRSYVRDVRTNRHMADIVIEVYKRIVGDYRGRRRASVLEGPKQRLD
jgi:glycosyltransferase involved in cell wall biosynthesis